MNLSTGLILKNIFWNTQSSTFKQTMLVLMGIILLFIASQLSIPTQPIPITFQSATVIFLAMAFGSRIGVMIILGYLFAGAVGLPVFENFGNGLTKFSGPTSGYLFGFLPAAFVSGYLAEKGMGKYKITSFFAASIGAAIIFAAGLIMLTQFIGWHQAVKLGLFPFIFSELIKLTAVACLIPRFWK